MTKPILIDYKNIGEPLGKVVGCDLSKLPWRIEVKAAKGKKRLLKLIAESPLLAGINIKIL